MPVVARFTSEREPGGTTLRLIPGASSIAAAPDRVQLEPGEVSHLLASQTLLLPGAGAVNVELSEADGRRLLQHGCVTVRAKLGDLTSPRHRHRNHAAHGARSRRLPDHEPMVTALRDGYRRQAWVDE